MYEVAVLLALEVRNINGGRVHPLAATIILHKCSRKKLHLLMRSINFWKKLFFDILKKFSSKIGLKSG